MTVADVLLLHPASEKRYYSVQLSGQIGIIKYKIYYINVYIVLY